MGRGLTSTLLPPASRVEVGVGLKSVPEVERLELVNVGKRFG